MELPVSKGAPEHIRKLRTKQTEFRTQQTPASPTGGARNKPLSLWERVAEGRVRAPQ